MRSVRSAGPPGAVSSDPATFGEDERVQPANRRPDAATASVKKSRPTITAARAASQIRRRTRVIPADPQTRVVQSTRSWVPVPLSTAPPAASLVFPRLAIYPAGAERGRPGGGAVERGRTASQ